MKMAILHIDTTWWQFLGPLENMAHQLSIKISKVGTQRV